MFKPAMDEFFLNKRVFGLLWGNYLVVDLVQHQYMEIGKRGNQEL